MSGGVVVVVSWVSHCNDEGIMSSGGELTCIMGTLGNSRIAAIKEQAYQANAQNARQALVAGDMRQRPARQRVFLSQPLQRFPPSHAAIARADAQSLLLPQQGAAPGKPPPPKKIRVNLNHAQTFTAVKQTTTTKQQSPSGKRGICAQNF